jgi:hypothetical protein
MRAAGRHLADPGEPSDAVLDLVAGVVFGVGSMDHSFVRCFLFFGTPFDAPRDSWILEIIHHTAASKLLQHTAITL